MNDNQKQAGILPAEIAGTPTSPARAHIRQDKFSTLRLACFRAPKAEGDAS
jgi:hypothetical protein